MLVSHPMTELNQLTYIITHLHGISELAEVPHNLEELSAGHFSHAGVFHIRNPQVLGVNVHKLQFVRSEPLLTAAKTVESKNLS